MLKKTKSGSKEGKGGDSPSRLIDGRIKELGDWRGEMLARIRTLIKQADPEVVEEWKWRGVPVWSHGGIICTGETYKSVVKMTFAKGASLEDPSGLFNSSLDGNVRRAIDFHEGDKIDEKALKALIRAAVALNMSVRAGAGRAPGRNQRAPERHRARTEANRHGRRSNLPANPRKLPLRQYPHHLRLARRRADDPRARLRLRHVREAWRRLDLAPGRAASR